MVLQPFFYAENYLLFFTEWKIFSVLLHSEVFDWLTVYWSKLFNSQAYKLSGTFTICSISNKLILSLECAAWKKYLLYMQIVTFYAMLSVKSSPPFPTTPPDIVLWVLPTVTGRMEVSLTCTLWLGPIGGKLDLPGNGNNLFIHR